MTVLITHSLLPHNIRKEIYGEIVITDISLVIFQSAVRCSHRCSFKCDFAVLHHLVFALHLTYHSHCFCWHTLLYHLKMY